MERIEAATAEELAGDVLAEELDGAWPTWRGEFNLPQHEGATATYLLGNSLGAQPKRARATLSDELDVWAARGVEGFFEDGAEGSGRWLTIQERHVQERLARVVGAEPGEVVAMNTLSVNLHQMLTAFYRPSGRRTKIVMEKHAFPSDHHVCITQVRLHGLEEASAIVHLTPREGERLLRTEDIVGLLERSGEEVALVMLPGVQYYTGEVLDMAAITAAARAAGCRVGFDLAHAVGNVELRLHEWGPDFACWCSYKYLNCGPGAVGGAFVHSRHAADASLHRLGGWWGHRLADRWLMKPAFHPEDGALGFQVSTASPLQIATLRASLELFDAATMPVLRAKSVALTRYLERLLTALVPDALVVTPADPRARGAQLTLEFPFAAKRIQTQLAHRGVIVDFREPSAIRAAPAPLYNTFRDCLHFVRTLADVLREHHSA
jgi:kynureninase